MVKYDEICFISYLAWDTDLVERNGKRDATANPIRNFILCGRKYMVTSVQNLFPRPGHNVGFAITEPSSSLNGLFTKGGLKGMLKGKYYPSVDSILSFGGAFADRFL